MPFPPVPGAMPGSKATEGSVLLDVKGSSSSKPSAWERLRQNREAMTVVACLMFMACSATMLIVNKLVVKHFSTPVLVVFAQNLMACLIVVTVLFRSLHFGSRADAIRFAKVVPLMYAGMLCTSAIAQQFASLGLQIVIRNLAPLVTLPIERIFNEPIVTDVWTWASMFVILGGVILYVIESLGAAPYAVPAARHQDLDTLLLGVLLMVANMVLAIVERLYQRKMLTIVPVDVSKMGMVLLNNGVSLVPLSILIFPMEEWRPAKMEHWGTAGPHGSTWLDYTLLIISGVCGVAIGWTSMNAQQYVTATTMLLITNLNKVVVIIFGMMFLAEPDGPFAIAGCAVALGGGVWYALVRRSLGKKEAAKKAQATDKKKEPLRA